MTDLYTALAVMLVASAAALAVALGIARAAGPRAAALLALLSCGFVVCFALLLRDHLLLTRLLPVSAVVIYGNALPPAVAFLTGIAWRRIPGGPARKAVLLLPLLALCLYQSYGFLLGRPPPLEDRWKGDVCRQTSPASCSAAAAATLLRAHGIEATEAEMARLCLTRSGGTPMHGLYRGLKLKTAGRGWDAEAFRGDLATLRNEGGPILLTVRLDRGAHVDPRYEQLWGWTPGVAHTVVFYGFRPATRPRSGTPPRVGSTGGCRTCRCCGTGRGSASSGRKRRCRWQMRIDAIRMGRRGAA